MGQWKYVLSKSASKNCASVSPVRTTLNPDSNKAGANAKIQQDPSSAKAAD
jgi:hypothetical protein